MVAPSDTDRADPARGAARRAKAQKPSSRNGTKGFSRLDD